MPIPLEQNQHVQWKKWNDERATPTHAVDLDLDLRQDEPERRELLHGVGATMLNESTVAVHSNDVRGAEAEKIKLLHLEHDQRPDGPLTERRAARLVPFGGHRRGRARGLGPRLGRAQHGGQRARPARALKARGAVTP